MLLVGAALLSATAEAATPNEKIRADLLALAQGERRLDPRIARRVEGYRPGELAYFAVLARPARPGDAQRLRSLGARVLHRYRSLDAFALASHRRALRAIAAQPWIAWLAPVELVFAADFGDQSKGTPGDVGAVPWWGAGVMGAGVRIAVLDTGLDAAHPDFAGRVVGSRNFVGGVPCGSPSGSLDGHGHGTHVAGVALGSGAGTPLPDDDWRYAGVAPGAELAVAKVMTDAGAGLNSDLIGAMEWAARPEGVAPCGIGADIVNLSLGSEARPTRLNSGSDTDMVSYALNRLAVQYGTLFVVAAGNSGPFLGSVLEAPGSAAQALTVAATAKDHDVNHDDTLSGDTCAGWQHAGPTCSPNAGTQPPSLASFSSRGPSGDQWLKPDVAAPGYNIVSAQAATGAAIASNDLNRGTRADPLYATASGTSMAAPATAGSAALVLQAYRARYGVDPTGVSGVSGLAAPPYALLRAALMNSAGGDLYESRWILTTDSGTVPDCPQLDPLLTTFCEIALIIPNALLASVTLYEVRNGASDPYVGPLGEGAGKLQVGRAIAALRDGIVAYSAASGIGADAGTGPRDLQGSWQVGAIPAGATQSQRFVLHAAPGAPSASVTFSFVPGTPSDGSRVIAPAKGSWSVKLPGKTTVRAGRDPVVTFSVTAPASAAPGPYTGVIVGRASTGQTIRIPVFATVPLHDRAPAAGAVSGAQAQVASGADVFGKADTIWPSAAGASGTGAGSDWLVYPVDLAAGLAEARLSVYDAAAGDETYDLYLFDSGLNLVASTHPFAAPGVTDANRNDSRGPSTQASPQLLSLAAPAAGRYYVAVSRAKTGGVAPGDFGAFVLTLDERA